jgi:hypothetical protein
MLDFIILLKSTETPAVSGRSFERLMFLEETADTVKGIL